MEFRLCSSAIVLLTAPSLALAQQEGRKQSVSPSAVACQVITAEELGDAQSVASALRGRATGLHLTPSSGQAGAGSRVSVRGFNSLRPRPPLVFVDGLLMSETAGGGQTMTILDQLNPNDVLAIEVFRGPAATTLYGTEGAGGVIRVHTKQGNPRATVVTDPRAQCIP